MYKCNIYMYICIIHVAYTCIYYTCNIYMHVYIYIIHVCTIFARYICINIFIQIYV